MNKVNFESLKNIKAPEAWLEKAAAIPETSVKKRAFSVPYRVAAAASLVLVSVIGLLVFLMHQGSNSVVVAPHGSYVATQTTTDSTTADGKTAETSVVPSLVGEVFPTEQVYPTNAQGQQVTESATVPTSSVTTLGETSASTQQQPTYRPTEQVYPTNAQGQQVTESATTPTSSATTPSATVAQQPIYRPTEPVGADITEAPTPTTEPTNPPKPTNPPTPATEEPTPPYNPPTNSEIYCTIHINQWSGGGNGNSTASIAVFCRLYDSSGHLVGDDSLFSPRRMAEILSVNPNGSLFVMYNPVEKGFSIQSGFYEYVFYDGTGEELYRDSMFFF